MGNHTEKKGRTPATDNWRMHEEKEKKNLFGISNSDEAPPRSLSG